MSSSRVFQPSDASRPESRSGILTPSSDSFLNRSHEALFGEARKRKRGASHAMEDLLKPSITVKPHGSNPLAKSCVLQPLMLLPREDLPISCLDLNCPNGDLSPSRFFESHIKILDLEGRMAERPSLLIARNETSAALYAIERHDDGLYTVCKLGQWVDLLVLYPKATVSSQQLLRLGLAEPRDTRSAPLTTSHLHKENKKRRLAIEALQSVVRKRGRSQSVSTFEATRTEKRVRSGDAGSNPESPSSLSSSQELEVEQETQQVNSDPQPSAPDAKPASLPPGDMILQPTANDMFDNIRNQYIEALYRSMGSLAYFAKGPLSRARAAFHLDCDGTLNMNDLIDFLKTLVLTTVQIDRKYRDSIPGIISRMKTTFDSSDDGSKAKKRKPKKMKLGKDALYPMEDENVQKWWSVNTQELKDHEEAITQSQIKSHVSVLRTRETQLQMILIMEILALEPLRVADDDVESQLPGLPGNSESQIAGSVTQPAKKRNKHNLPVLADVHADRLCIWQSTLSDEQKLIEDSQVASHTAEGQQAQKSSSDPLRDFCVDIIMPFFSARLPELCDSINRKLGGPIIVSPPKPKQSKLVQKPDQKPGAAAKRPGTGMAPKAIERALYKEQSRRSMSRGPSNTIALMRSATSAVIPGLKREGSEPPALRSIPKMERGLMDRTNLLSRSNSMSNLDDAKARKRAQVEAELKDAITALRRPNRELVGNAIVDAAEQRASGSLSHTRKSKKPTRHPLFQSVQVKATPANSRFRDALAAESDLPQMNIPPSSASVIPSTAPRRGHRDAVGGSASSAVQATPLRKSGGSASFLRVPAMEDTFIPPSSPLMARREPNSQHLTVPGSVIRERASPTSFPSTNSGRLFQTPLKAKTGLKSAVLASKPAQEDTVPLERRVSIYQRLGWDDDLDDL